MPNNYLRTSDVPAVLRQRVAIRKNVCQTCPSFQGIYSVKGRPNICKVRCVDTDSDCISLLRGKCPKDRWPDEDSMDWIQPIGEAGPYGDATSPMRVEKLLLQCRLSPGDVVMLTAAVRDLHLAYPGRFLTDVDTPCNQVWENNPYITPLTQDDPGVCVVPMHYPLINQSNQRPNHFIRGYTSYLEQQLGLSIPTTAFRGDIYLTDQEMGWMNQVEETFAHREPFWIIVAGGKHDFTAKWWNPTSYQAIVDHFKSRIKFVQCGASGHWHVPLQRVLNLVGKTDIRQFIRLMYHAEGVICPVTLAMHLAAAVPTKDSRLRPCVVLAGGREPPHWEAYPGHQFLHTIGMLGCCAHGGCWKSRCQIINDGDSKDRENLCERPIRIDDELSIPECMAKITPDQVIACVESYIGFH